MVKTQRKQERVVDNRKKAYVLSSAWKIETVVHTVRTRIVKSERDRASEMENDENNLVRGSNRVALAWSQHKHTSCTKLHNTFARTFRERRNGTIDFETLEHCSI